MMKDITDYFLSPSKVSIEEPPKRIKKKITRKPIDPEVKDNIETEVLSNQSLIGDTSSDFSKEFNSPSSPTKKPKKKKRSLENTEQSISPFKSTTDKGTQCTANTLGISGSIQKNSKEATNHGNKINDTSTSDIAETDNAEINSATMKDTPKVNAFKFMMDSRNIVIGENSNGKILASEPESIISGSKPKMDTRKELFKNWADKKGALKRRRDEEEVEKCIHLKLEKRAKRLKKLIQGKTEERKELVKGKESKSTKSKKFVKLFHSFDSEDSTALPPDESSREPKSSSPQLIGIGEVIEENAQDAVLTISSPPTKKEHSRENNQNNLLNFFGILGKDATQERIEVFDDSSKQPSKELIKIKMFTKMGTKRRRSPLSLNRDLSNSITDESSQEGVKSKKCKKKKKKRKDKYERSLSEVQLNDSLEDFCSPEAKKINTNLKKAKNHKVFKNDHHNDKKKCNSLNSGPIITEDQIYQKNCTKRTDGCASLKIMSNERPLSELQKIDELKNVELKGSRDFSNNKNVQVMYDSTSSSDILLCSPKKNQNTKRCRPLSDDSDSAISAVGPNDQSSSDLSVPNKSKLKHFINDLGDPESSVDDILLQVVGKSLKSTDLQDPDMKLMMKIRDDHNSKDSCQNFTNMTTNTRRRRKHSKKDIQILKNEDVMKSKDIEPQGRVLRPKRNNLNYSDLFKDKTTKNPKANKKEKLSGKSSGTSSNKNESIEQIEVSSDPDYEEATKEKVPVKVAPIFLKATPKPKLNPEVIEARKKFLMSGVPDSLKKSIDKQKSIEEREYEIFPNVSHIQQKCENEFWDLPRPNLKYASVTSAFNPDEQNLIVHDLIVKKPTYEVNITTENKKISHVKSVLNKIKGENSNYPVYKVFRHIYEKSGKNYLKELHKRKKSPKKRSKKYETKSTGSIEPPSSFDDKAYEMWSEKYKPRCSEEILGNHSGVKALKTWLEIWMNYSEEINARGRRKMTNSNSESEFESTDCDSRDSTRLPGNTMIIGGPCGSGKTSAVYAIANELGFNVLELNASSKRTGKRLVQELQEATQSHQVRKNKGLTMATFTDKTSNNALKSQKGKETEQNETTSEQGNKKKMCILLIEDIDLVFDQDDGFLTSLGQLIMTSKRPVILTTTDNSPVHVQKLLAQNEYISFMPLSVQCLNVWLQIVCLVEGLLVDKDDLGSLLDYNGGDIRKTLLEVQFWTQSGGQLEKLRSLPLKSKESKSSGKCRFKFTDEDLKLDLSEDQDQENYFVHKHCIGSFEVLRENKEYNVPQSVNLGTLWWNIPNIFNVPSCASERLHRQKFEKNDEATSELTIIDSNEKDEIQLDSVQSFYDALILTDSLCKSINYQNSNEPVVRNWMTGFRDSIELTERTEDQALCLDMVRDLTHTLVDGCIENYNRIDETKCHLDMTLPDGRERRWRAKQYMCENFLKEPIPLLNALDRPSLAVDYLPVLRDIARCEEKRAASNTKRGNRFRHYLKNLNMDFKEGTCKLACNVLLNATD